MMEAFALYYHGKIVGIYDDRSLVKPTKSVLSCISTAVYEGIKEMLLVDEVFNRII